MSGLPGTDEGLSVALLLVVAMSLAGMIQVLWLARARHRFLLLPLDFGATFRGHRLLGDNKRLRGFVGMPLAACITFAFIGVCRDLLPDWFIPDSWNMSVAEYALVGLGAGVGFMLAELPNSFVKRQLGIAPGEIPRRGWARALCLVADRLDSVIGAMIAVALLAPVPAMSWAWVLAIGPGLHAAFSALLHRFGVKGRRL